MTWITSFTALGMLIVTYSHHPERIRMAITSSFVFQLVWIKLLLQVLHSTTQRMCVLQQSYTNILESYPRYFQCHHPESLLYIPWSLITCITLSIIFWARDLPRFVPQSRQDDILLFAAKFDSSLFLWRNLSELRSFTYATAAANGIVIDTVSVDYSAVLCW